MTHTAIRVNEELYCTRCGKRWEVGEDPPPCEPVAERQPRVKPQPLFQPPVSKTKRRAVYPRYR